MVVLLTYGLCNRKKPVSHLTSAARLACSKERDTQLGLLLHISGTRRYGVLYTCRFPNPRFVGVLLLALLSREREFNSNYPPGLRFTLFNSPLPLYTYCTICVSSLVCGRPPLLNRAAERGSCAFAGISTKVYDYRPILLITLRTLSLERESVVHVVSLYIELELS